MSVFVSPKELVALKLSSHNHAMLDVRERYEYDREHIPGSVSLPRGMLELSVERVCPARDVPIILCCDDGERSLLASKTLDSLGYGDVRVLSGGIKAWRNHELLLLKGNSLTGKMYGEGLAASDKVKFIDANELAKKLSADECIVLDTRTKAEYEVGHIPRAFWAGGDIAECALSVMRGNEIPIVVHCAGRTRSILAGYVLREHFGLTQVYSLRNGTMAWEMAGFRLEPGLTPGRPEIKPHAANQAAEIARRICERDGLASITPRYFVDLLARQTPCYVFDVRPNREYIAKHIRGSISCEGSQMALRADDLMGLNNLPVIICSDSLVRSVVPGLFLKKMGYGDVRILEGGIEDWGKSGIKFGEEQIDSGVPTVIAPAAGIEHVSVEDLQLSLERESPVTIVDVRNAKEFAPQHIRGSIWIPRGQLEFWAGELLAKKSEAHELVMICDNGQRSLLAVSTLRNMGYKSVRFLKGGLNAWTGKGLTVEVGWNSAKVSLAMVKEEIPPVHRVGALARTHDEMIAYLKSEVGLSHV